MVEQPTVVVRGGAVREVPPEVASFSVTVSARDKDRQSALTRLAERAASIRALLDDAGEAIERRETGGVHLHPELKRAGERVVAYAGSVTTTVTVTDFTVLGELMLRLGDQEQTAISGPWWALRPGSTAGAEVRRAAIADALDRAREYAAAVGASLDRLIEIADEGTGGGGAQPRMRSFGTFAAAEAQPLELDVDPQPQTVQASVQVRFSITEPTALT
ncbi:MAG TPA: SIMPL domain-containing protein [Actinoplanes sp.]|nr:SIMPL domain-containing protein [Actinoplanes sp.]